ncbi:potassium channel family protein [Rhodoferax sp.]|uniref:potassium channel family protein n=1 Tax=Rhodoferax sp. TaxID=50421 RepID=UPI0025CEE476|nr:potassium channel family protein [Rhodoferax sp.]
MRKVKLHKLVIGRRGLLYSLGLCMLILGMGGLGFWALEPQAETLSDGLWLAFTTAATVGYGDIVPSTHASRTFSVVVVLMGLAVLSLVTASVAAMLVEVEEREVEGELMREIHALRLEVRHLRGEVRAQPAATGQEKADTPRGAPAGPLSASGNVVPDDQGIRPR